jgi:predicted PurR-regulated permease PerM
MQDTARKALVASLIVVAVVASALALWKLRIVLALLFLALIIAASMRPSVEALARRHIPRGIGILAHYAALAGLIAILLWAIVPRAIDQVDNALGGIPTSSSELERQTSRSTGFKHEILVRIQDGLDELPSGAELVDSSLSLTFTAFEVLVGVFFTFACAAYWIFERDRAELLVMSLLPRQKRRVVRDTWNLIDAKLGAYVRGMLILIMFVASVLSVIFYLIGLPFWLLIGIFAGLVEIVPVLGPIAAGAVAVGVGLTDSWQLALAAGFAVFLAIPFAAVLATLLDVVIRHRNPAEEETPAVLFPAKENES